MSDYVKRHYGVPADIGRRVEVDGKPGIIAADRGHYIGVNFDADKPGVISNCHPTWRVVYGEMGTIRKLTRSQMGTDTKIEWAHHTFNPWIGCAKVSEGCSHCYAERFGKRVGVTWGGERRMTSTWSQPRRWNRQAYENQAAWRAGVRPRVFCGSLCDVFDPVVDDDWRHQLMTLIHDCTNLRWLLLTKRPDQARDYFTHFGDMSRTDHVWIGTSVEDQATADERIPHLLQIPCVAGRFLSCEPLLGPVNLRSIPRPDRFHRQAQGWESWLAGELHWVIAGGESGPQARPMHPDWVCSLRDQCQGTGISFFFKQWGEWCPRGPKSLGYPSVDGVPCIRLTNHGGDDQVGDPGENPVWMHKAGKKRAGRLLDGREWNEVPA